jgi:hypothetical protein
MEMRMAKKSTSRPAAASAKPVMMWAAVSYDNPPEIWEVGWYKDKLQYNLRKIRVMVTPLPRKARQP